MVVREAMIVPQTVQGGGKGVNGCSLVSNYQNSRDLCLQSAAMEQKSKGVIENCNLGPHDVGVGWKRNSSEGSISSMDSLPCGETVFSPSDPHNSVFRKPRRLGVSESDDESVIDQSQEESLLRKSKRSVMGGTVQPHSAMAQSVDEAAPDHSSTPSDDGKDFPSSRVKFMCSFGGKILPRPSDQQLRYVGGQTRIIGINRDVNFSELRNKMRESFGQCYTFKYQLPDEDLDALVTVSSDEDLENMMEEYDKLEADGSSRLRVFLFPADQDATSFDIDSTGDLRNSEQRYVDAVNGIAESSTRRISDGVLGASPVSSDLLGLELSEPSWGLARGPDAVPMAMLATHHDPNLIHQVPVAHPVSALTGNLSNRSNAPSAPSSAPSSPPLLARNLHGKLPLVGELHQFQYLQDSQFKGVGPQYTGMPSEVAHQDSESYGGSGGSSAASQHEMHYRSTDSRRGPESPPKKFHDALHQDHPITVEQRRLSGTKMPRIGSHGKLTRLSEHSELAPSSRVDSQQMPDIHMAPGELQRLFPQQVPLQQTLWPHAMDTQQDSYRRPDMLQSSGAQPAVSGQQQQGYQPQQQLQHLFRSGLSQTGANHEGAYRQGDQQQQSQQFQEDLHVNPNYIPRSVSSHAIAAGIAAGQSTSYHGSAPSSPRPGFRELPSRHLPGGPQLQHQWTFNGAGYVDQGFGRRVMNYPDQATRSFRLSSSPPRYRDHHPHSEERLHRQAQQVSEPLHHEQVPVSGQLKFETNSVSQAQYDLVPRPQVPQYKGHNPFQEKITSFQDHQEVGDIRRHVLQQGKDNQLLAGQQHLHSILQPQRIDYQESLKQQGDQSIPIHPRFQDGQEKVAEWMVQERALEEEEARKRVLGRIRQAELEEEAAAEAVVSQHKDTHQGVYAGLHLPNDEDLLTSSLGDYPSGNRRNERLESSISNAFPFRHLPPSVLGGYTAPKSRVNPTETSHVAQYVSRPVDTDYLAVAGLRGGGNGQDMRSAALFEVNGLQQTSGYQMPSGPHRLMEERLMPSAFNPITQLQKLRINDNLALNNDMRWSGSEDVRNEPSIPARDRMGGIYEDHHQGLPGLTLGRSAGKLSRPSSNTSIPNLLDETIGEGSLLPSGPSYGTQAQGTNLIDITQSISAIDNPLYSTSYASRLSNTSLGLDSPLVTSGGMLNSSLEGTSFSDYYKIKMGDDLPNAKMPSSKIPSAEDNLSRSSSSSLSELSKSGSEDGLGGQLTMDQRTVDMVVAALDLDRSGSVVQSVLESSDAKEASLSESVHDHSLGKLGSVVGSVGTQSVWPLDSAPTLAAGLWEKKLDEAGMTEETFERHITSDGTTFEELTADDHEVLASTVDKENQEEVRTGLDEPADEDKANSTGLGSDPAAKAIARGLQTIKNADLEELRELGSGTFGTVYHGKWRGTDVAIKRIKASCFAGRPSEQERLIEDFWREACNLGHLHHPNVVAFYGVVADGPGGTLATVTEYMVNGSLKQVLQKKDRTIDRRKRLLIAMDAAFGMEYLHGKNIVHFDLKCENLLVNMRDPHRPICKVGDLGLSKVKHQTMVSGGVRGTLPWMAPELLNGNSSLVTEKVDVFSFGIVMWELLTGEEPYDKMHYGAIIGGIVNNTLRPLIPSWCDPAWRSLMERCWANEPAVRPSFSDIAKELRTMAAALQPKTQAQTQGQSHPHPQMQIV
ncbi:protein MpPRAF [Marchantia polymorpha subsp. ruderalis]|uniref:RAF-like serine/threonine-protein kinase PRAF n=1 Tax=Marchantia polymorpha TaxID=3197 RepID=PRAF_MARPO|nr:hypothetical protein MARPO_0013s0150 [Marchantia polymorpha]BBN18896.1 hypothetical protein Mp_8g06400 [Marchantia polymorpha subsp. ruderalis]BBO36689.1 Raf-like kinase [Marchantia polymorpha]|eukprot:PTQ45948.1 hypothetical protein MARPO_0013s0150 [Marchantia polymorpha]